MPAKKKVPIKKAAVKKNVARKAPKKKEAVKKSSVPSKLSVKKKIIKAQSVRKSVTPKKKAEDKYIRVLTAEGWKKQQLKLRETQKKTKKKR